MLRFFTRPFSIGRPFLLKDVQIPEVKLSPKLAAKQFIGSDVSFNRERRLRRKERRMKKQIIRDVNTLKQYDIKNVPFQVDPVLGDPRSTFMPRVLQKVENSEYKLAYGIDRVELEKVLYAQEKLLLEKAADNEELRQDVEKSGKEKKNAVLTILNLRNTNSQDKKKMAIQYAREEVQRYDGDTASPEVQAAILTVKIHFGMDHVKANKNDHASRQLVRELVQYRQKLLRYLKEKNPERYYYALAKLGLTDDVVVREFSMGKQYLQDYKIWGDKVLVKETASMKRKNMRLKNLKDKVNEYHQLAKKNFEILNREKQKTTTRSSK
ncbi:hypothetical protein KGF56_003205 [Candida oxycetoniae]|uniref:37S ribosomal protein S28, mitochondrial n=1 Tax=Candida oxycetoniae TaxID=497107 RepID=A0AAI9SVW3_9ASCO|nr:uncharacterized protein KGF56_003205 [Candida oxycetoniae]KAI3404046.2 hypothetical protein KGF56_003205 [Candida oxycetoniae]